MVTAPSAQENPIWSHGIRLVVNTVVVLCALFPPIDPESDRAAGTSTLWGLAAAQLTGDTGGGVVTVVAGLVTLPALVIAVLTLILPPRVLSGWTRAAVSALFMSTCLIQVYLMAVDNKVAEPVWLVVALGLMLLGIFTSSTVAGLG